MGDLKKLKESLDKLKKMIGEQPDHKRIFNVNVVCHVEADDQHTAISIVDYEFKRASKAGYLPFHYAVE